MILNLELTSSKKQWKETEENKVKEEFVRALKDPENWSPKVSKIAEQLGMSPSGVSEYIKRHAEKIRVQVRILGPEELMEEN